MKSWSAGWRIVDKAYVKDVGRYTLTVYKTLGDKWRWHTVRRDVFQIDNGEVELLSKAKWSAFIALGDYLNEEVIAIAAEVATVTKMMDGGKTQ